MNTGNGTFPQPVMRGKSSFGGPGQPPPPKMAMRSIIRPGLPGGVHHPPSGAPAATPANLKTTPVMRGAGGMPPSTFRGGPAPRGGPGAPGMQRPPIGQPIRGNVMMTRARGGVTPPPQSSALMRGKGMPASKMSFAQQQPPPPTQQQQHQMTVNEMPPPPPPPEDEEKVISEMQGVAPPEGSPMNDEMPPPPPPDGDDDNVPPPPGYDDNSAPPPPPPEGEEEGEEEPPPPPPGDGDDAEDMDEYQSNTTQQQQYQQISQPPMQSMPPSQMRGRTPVPQTQMRGGSGMPPSQFRGSGIPPPQSQMRGGGSGMQQPPHMRGGTLAQPPIKGGVSGAPPQPMMKSAFANRGRAPAPPTVLGAQNAQQSVVHPPIMPQQQQGVIPQQHKKQQQQMGRGRVLSMAPPPPAAAAAAGPAVAQPAGSPMTKPMPTTSVKVQGKQSFMGGKSSSSSSLPEYIAPPPTQMSGSPSPGIGSPKGARPRLSSGITAPPSGGIFVGDDGTNAEDHDILDVPPPALPPGQQGHSTLTLEQSDALDSIANMDFNSMIGINPNMASPGTADIAPPPISPSPQSASPLRGMSGGADQFARKMSSPSMPQGQTPMMPVGQIRTNSQLNMQSRLVKERSNSAAPFSNLAANAKQQQGMGASVAPYLQVSYSFGQPLLTMSMPQSPQSGSKPGTPRLRATFKNSPRASITSRNTAAAAAAADSRSKLRSASMGPDEAGASGAFDTGVLDLRFASMVVSTPGQTKTKGKGKSKRKAAKGIDITPTQCFFECFKRGGEGSGKEADGGSKGEAEEEIELGDNKRYDEFSNVDFARFYGGDPQKIVETFTGAFEDAKAYESILGKVTERNEFEMFKQDFDVHVGEDDDYIPAPGSSGTRSPAVTGSPRLSVGSAADKGNRGRVGSSPFAPANAGKAGGASGLLPDSSVPREFSVPADLWTCSAEEFGTALSGDRALDERMQQIAVEVKKVPQEKKNNIIRVLVCGDSTAKKGSWLVSLLGYGVLRNPTGNVMSRRVWLGDTLYYVQIKLSSGYSDAEVDQEITWANAFVLYWDVESRASYDAIPQLHQDITHQKNKLSLPMVIVMGNSSNAPEAAWSVTHTEAESLSDMLNVPLQNGMTTEDVAGSLHRLVEEFDTFKNEKNQPLRKRTDSLLGSIKRTQSGAAGAAGADGGGIDKSDVKGELEFVVLGDAFVGKTTFAKRVFDRTFLKTYNTTSSKFIRRKLIEMTSGDAYTIKLIDTPGYFVEKSAGDGADSASTTSAQSTSSSTTTTTGSGSSSSTVSYSSANTEAAAAAAAAAAERLGSPLMRSAATSTVNWLKQESLLQSQAFIAMFSMTSYQSFEYACDLIDHIQTARMETPDAKAPIVFLLGNKSDLLGLRAVDPRDIHRAAQRLGCSYAIVSCKDIENGNVFEALNQFVDECTIIGKAQVHEYARKPTAEFYSKQGYMFFGKEKRKCKTKMLFHVHDGVLQYGSNEKDFEALKFETLSFSDKTFFETDARQSQPLGGAGGGNAGTEANIHITIGQTKLWLLAQPESERNTWEAVIRLNMIRGKTMDPALAAQGGMAAAAALAGGAQGKRAVGAAGGMGAGAAMGTAAALAGDQQTGAGSDERHSHRSLLRHHKKKE